MKRHEPEQLNKPEVSEEYRLEDILREFGADSDKQGPFDDTRVFQPVRSEPPDPQPDEPTKVAEPTEKPDTAPAKAAQPPSSAEIPIFPESVPAPVTEKEPISQRPKTPPVRPSEEVRRTHTKPPKPPAPPHVSAENAPETEAPATPQELLRGCQKGMGMLRLRLFLLALVAAAQAFYLLYNAFSWDFFPFLQLHGGKVALALAVLSLLLAYNVLLSGVGDLFRLRISLNTLGVLSAALTLIHAAGTLSDGTQSYCPVLSLLLLFLLRADYARRSGNFFTLRTLCAFETPMGIFDTPRLLEKTDSLRRDTADTEDFMRGFSEKDLPQKALCVYATALLPLTAAAAYFLSKRSGTGFLLAWLLLLLGAIPFAGSLSFVRPFSLLAKRLSRFGGALCGWRGARIFGAKHTIILRDGDLFPRSHISSNGMKLYGPRGAERVIGYALAVLEAAENPMTDLFEAQLQVQHGKHYRVTSFRFYDNNGIGAEVAGDLVLVGTLGFMRSMGVHMPDGTRVRQAVYVSVNGDLAGIFAVKYKPDPSTRNGLRDVLANRNFSVVLATRDFLISPELLAAKYGVPTDGLVFPAFPERIRLSDAGPKEAASQGALIAKDTFGAFASTVAAGRTLRITSLLSLALSLLTGIFGLLLCAFLILWDSVSVANPPHLAAFQLLWACLNGFISYLLLKL